MENRIRPYRWLITVPEDRRKENGRQTIPEKLTTEKFPELTENKFWDSESTTNPSQERKITSMETHSRETEEQQREEFLQPVRGRKNLSTNDCNLLAQTMESKILKTLTGNNCHPGML